jgi:hypothetical protein
MKKKFSNGFIAALGLVCLSCIFSGCKTAEIREENIAPTGVFDVNISSACYLFESGHYGEANDDSATLMIDGDTILIWTYCYPSWGIIHGLIVEPNNWQDFEYLTNNISMPTNFYYTEALTEGISISNTVSADQQWKKPYSNGPNKIQLFTGNDWPLSVPVFDLPQNADSYIVFRRIKAAGYQYYWIKLRYEYDAVMKKYILSAIDGKYKMDNIITGQ